MIFKPGIKLRELFCASKPHDKRKCTLLSDCKICPNLSDGYDSTVEYPLYRIPCQLCNERYIGESCRTVHDRLSEHFRFANNPTAPSYMEEAMAVHYRQKTSGDKANLNLLRQNVTQYLEKFMKHFIFIIRNQKLMIILKLSYYIGF